MIFKMVLVDFIGFITLIIYELKIREKAGKNISKDARDKYFILIAYT